MASRGELFAPEPPPNPPTDLPCPVVGVGASAGGLEAFKLLLGAFPIATGMALVLVSHLDPQHPSMLAELLAKTTSLPVQVVVDGIPVVPNQVYVIPPNTTLRIVDQHFQLTPRAEAGQPHQPINSLFLSLADAYGPAAIGVVLSGMGSDGTLGLSAIKTAGGATLAQDPASAAYSQLPQSAIAAGCVDLVLPPAELAAAIVRLAQNSRLTLAQDTGLETGDQFGYLQPLFVLVREATGIDFSAYKPSTILRRLQRRIAISQSGTLPVYLEYLRKQPDEAQTLARDFLIRVTEFFRDPEAFVALQQTVLTPLLLQKPQHTAVRIWVVGCATGQEAYSLAMLLTETAEQLGSSATPQIFATDLNDVAIALARAGIYSMASVQSLTPARRERFLVPAELGYRVSTKLRESCVFAQHNLVSDPPFSNLDLICCRNVLIYLSRPLQQHVLPLLHYALKPGGVLMLGAAEQLLVYDDLFAPLDSSQRLYVRTGVTRKFAFTTLPYVQSRATVLPAHTVRAVSEKDRVMDQTAHRIMATHYAQPGVLITAGYDILHIYGHTGRYLEPAPGETTMNLLRMARDGLLAALQNAVEQATAQQAVVRIERVRLLTLDETRSVTLEVTPIRDTRTDTQFFLIVFLEVPSGERVRERESRRSGTAPVLTEEWHEEVQALRIELAASKAYLRMIITEQATTNDDLKLLNEELLSRNEEVQSINEELQTAKEEVQSINEELITVNEELQQRNHELKAVNSDLHRLLASINIPIIVVDRTGAIAHFTPPVAQILGLRASDIGRPLRNYAADIAVPALDQVIAEVQQRRQLAEFPLENHDGNAHLLRIWPAYAVDGSVDGVVLIWIDVTALKRAEAQQRRLERSLLETQKRESLGVLAGGIAHDFNNLLAIILGNVQLALLDLEPDAPISASLRQIEAKSQQAVDLTGQMLAFAGKSHRELAVVDLNALIASTNNLLMASVGKQIKLQYQLIPTPLWVQLDTTQIRQVLVNLVLNAAEAVSSPEMVVTIRSDIGWFSTRDLAAFQVGAANAAGQYALLEVADSGVGMDQPTIAKIFEPFFSTKFTGRGLGLAAVLGIVQDHGGAIKVASRPGQGTTMTIALPVLAVAPESDGLPQGLPQTVARSMAASEPVTTEVLARPGPGVRTVLVIDDEEAVRGITTRLLARLGFQSLTAADGAEGIALLQQHATEIALILLDVTMPGLTMPQILQLIRANWADLPVLLISGYPQEAIQDVLPDVGFLHKPFSLEQLDKALKQMVKTSP